MGRLEIESSEKCSIWVDSRLNKVKTSSIWVDSRLNKVRSAVYG